MGLEPLYVLLDGRCLDHVKAGERRQYVGTAEFVAVGDMPEGIVARLAAEISPGARICTNRQCLMIELLDDGLLDALARLLGLLQTPELREPLIEQEIIVRLLEARQLMLNKSLDAATAGLQVGYESPSQFNREYARFFGEPPLRDIKRLRAGGEPDALR
ncbi:helix-turn-helix domain-containing protein [Oceanimonas baumannii]|uniref:AraC-like DNA-binding protein n=2 Tax=Oceanimonas baumannii TaxID=129578 RepID=A0ABY2F1G1_9GAMM|nr:AraC family transcriptional regulator [Oceanimonas baumannii]TDW61197.1 AraC-like DNA-binding protein [Oceanimonas baumannii]